MRAQHAGMAFKKMSDVSMLLSAGRFWASQNRVVDEVEQDEGGGPLALLRLASKTG